VNRLFEIDRIDLVDQIMDIVFAYLPDELSKNWLKMQQFLCFLCEVTKSGDKQLLYMAEKGLVGKLIDFFLENDSPKALGQRRNQMGSNYANPPFENLINNVWYIALH
jgi:hypothetical protein